MSSGHYSDLTPLQTAVLPLLHMTHVSSLDVLGGFNDSSTLLLTQTEFETVVITLVSDRLYTRIIIGDLLPLHCKYVSTCMSCFSCPWPSG